MPDGPHARLLFDLVNHPQLSVWPTSTGHRHLLAIGAISPDRDLMLFSASEPGSVLSGGVPHAPEILREVERLSIRGFPGPKREIEAGLALGAVADSFQADGIVSGGSVLLLRDWNPRTFRHTAVLSVEEGVAIAGLKLRSIDDIRLGHLRVDVESCYWTLVRDLTPAGWSWFSACMRDRALSAPANACFIRLCRALKARDRCQSGFQFRYRPRFQDILYHLDMLLVSLAGAVDAAAHVADRLVLNGASRPEDIGWRRAWLGKLNSGAPRLAGLVKDGTQGRAVLDCLAHLRNLIHHYALVETEHHSGGLVQYLLELPDSPLYKSTLRDVVLAAAEAAGGADRWGLRREENGTTFVAIDRYIEQLTPAVFALLDALIREMEWYRGCPENPRPSGWHFTDASHEALLILSGLSKERFPQVLQTKHIELNEDARY